MADLDFYKRHLHVSGVDAICDVLCETFIETNRTFDFFVDWAKVLKNREAFKYEVALLKSLRNSSNPSGDLANLLKRYPEVVRVIPLLLACRDGIIKVLDSIEPTMEYKTFDFYKKGPSTPAELKQVVEFTEKTGLLRVLCGMESAGDYLLGVEVGLDSNARKNRSGLFLEKLVREAVEVLVKHNPETAWVEQKKFEYVESKFEIGIPASLRKKKFDHIIISGGRATNIEVNFYSGTGSKPSEIVNSYINRCEVLAAAGWKFVWLTDGEGWKAMRNPLRLGVEHIDYVINVDLLRKRFLERILVTSKA